MLSTSPLVATAHQRAEEIASLRNKEKIAQRIGAYALATSYQRERLELECELADAEYVTCPACSGAGEVEDFYRSMKWHPCRVCDSEGTVRS